MNNYRKQILDSLVPYFRKDYRYCLLICDMGFGAVDRIRKEFPGRVINCGIMEQATVGIAAGMSMAGHIPVVYSIVNFLVFRALEQMRNDVILQKLNVKFISTGVNDYFKFLGLSHCCGNADVKIMDIINMRIYDPYSDGREFQTIVEDWITHPEAGYIRV